MLKRALALLCLVCLMTSLLPPVTAEEETSFFAYFEDARWLRTEPKANTPTVVNVPERSLLRLTPVNDKYAHAVYQGQEGYIHMKDYKKIDYIDPHSEEAVTVEGFFGAPVRMRANPLPNSALVDQLPTDERMRITYVTKDYAYLTFNGKEGYVFIADFVPMDYQKGSVEPYIVFSDEDVKAFDSPYHGALELATIKANTPVSVSGFDGDHLLVTVEDQLMYVDGGEMTALLEDFAVESFSATVKNKVNMLEYPLKNAAKIGSVKKDAEVTVLAYQGDYVRVQSGDATGYIPADQLKSSSAAKAAQSAFNHHLKSIAGRKFLDVALSMMEEGNPILRMYNEYCEGEVTARYQYGVPYLFAGSKESSILKIRYPSQNSNYYFTDKKYLGGYDCIGFARWLHNQVGMRKLPAISEMPNQNKKYVVNVKNKSMEEWADEMQVGDAIGMGYKGGGYHVMVYIGTLGSFGYTKEMLGETLAPYINYPLVIHCGMNNYHTAWYTEYLQNEGIEGVVPPDGGVTISIIGVPYDKCPYTETMWEGTKNVKTFHWFDLEGYNLTSIDPTASGIKWYTVFRNVEK
ncbi:MAG: C40 family peptidase [Clostridia bacterium]|nr:C40 family peptidase [Clostridia bacterium]